MADNNPRTKKIKKRTIETFEEIEMVEDPVKFNNPPPPVLYTVSLLSPSVYYTHDFRPKNREW